MSVEALTSDDQDRILKEIGYSRAQLQNDIPALRLWLQQQTHLPQCRLEESDVFLSNYLVGCKGSVETAKKKIDHYYSLRGKGDLFNDRDSFDYVIPASKHTSLAELPKNEPDSCGVTITTLLDDNVEIYDGIEVLKMALLMFEKRLRTGGICGQQLYILDAKDYTISHFMRVPPTALKAFLSFFQEAYPIRVKKILIVNVHPVLATAINTVVLPFLSKKLKERFFLTSDPVEKVYDHVDLLPVDYKGGKSKSLRELSDELIAQIRTLTHLLPELREEVDESRRPRLENGINDPYFGMHGSIKALVLD